jgi:hypothetical protein
VHQDEDEDDLGDEDNDEILGLIYVLEAVESYNKDKEEDNTVPCIKVRGQMYVLLADICYLQIWQSGKEEANSKAIKS